MRKEIKLSIILFLILTAVWLLPQSARAQDAIDDFAQTDALEEPSGDFQLTPGQEAFVTNALNEQKNLLDGYPYGSVIFELDKNYSSFTAGSNASFSGSYANTNNYPLAGGVVLARILRNSSVVSEKIIAESFTIVGGETKQFNFVWPVPKSAPSGTYRLNLYFLSGGGQYAISGTPSINFPGAEFIFEVENPDAGTYLSFNRGALKINGQNLSSLESPPVMPAGKAIALSVPLEFYGANTTTATLTWRIHGGSAQSNSLPIVEGTKRVEVKPGAPLPVEFKLDNAQAGAYEVVVTAVPENPDVLPVYINWLFFVEGQKPKIAFSGVTGFDGEYITITTYVADSAFGSGQSGCGNLQVNVISSGQNIAQDQKTINAGQLVASVLKIPKNIVGNDFTVSVSATDASGKIVSQNSSSYQTKSVTETKKPAALNKTQIYWLLIISVIIAVIIVIILLFKRKRSAEILTIIILGLFWGINASAVTFDELMASVNQPIVNCDDKQCFVSDTFGWPGNTRNKKATYFSSPSISVMLLGPNGSVNISCNEINENQFTLPEISIHGKVGGILFIGGGLENSVTFEGTNTNTGRMRVNVNGYRPIYKCVEEEENCSVMSYSLSGSSTVLFRDNWTIASESDSGSSQDLGCWTNKDQTITCTIKKTPLDPEKVYTYQVTLERNFFGLGLENNKVSRFILKHFVEKTLKTSFKINIDATSFCGNKKVDAITKEECDWGKNNSDTTPNACRTDCSDPYCGDGVVDGQTHPHSWGNPVRPGWDAVFEECDNGYPINDPLQKGIGCYLCQLIINGKCGTAASSVYPSTAKKFDGTLCKVGTPDPKSPVFPTPGNTVYWICRGSGGGKDSSNCSAAVRAESPPKNEVGCGTANNKTYLNTQKDYEEFQKEGALCTNGNENANPRWLYFPAPGSSTTWKCKGSDVTCTVHVKESPGGTCGTADSKTYPHDAKDFGTDSLCADGSPNPLKPEWPEPGNIVKNIFWSCVGTDPNKGQSCRAYLGPIPTGPQGPTGPTGPIGPSSSSSSGSGEGAPISLISPNGLCYEDLSVTPPTSEDRGCGATANLYGYGGGTCIGGDCQLCGSCNNPCYGVDNCDPTKWQGYCIYTATGSTTAPPSGSQVSKTCQFQRK